jgi:hypothetical protein
VTLSPRPDLAELRSTHQYQYDGSHRNRNECTLCAMAMLLTRAGQQSGQEEFVVPAAQLGRFVDRIPFRYPRFPAWFPGPGGATHPMAALWGLQAYGRKLRRDGTRFPWQPRLTYGASPADLEAALAGKQPTLIFGMGGGVPHVVVPVQREVDGWAVLDPGYPTASNPAHWSDAQLQKWWTNFSVFYPRGVMITLEPEID